MAWNKSAPTLKIIRDEAINSLRRFWGKIRLNLEVKIDHATLFEMVTKVGNLGAVVSG
jgi:hypothetical protein